MSIKRQDQTPPAKKKKKEFDRYGAGILQRRSSANFIPFVTFEHIYGNSDHVFCFVDRVLKLFHAWYLRGGNTLRTKNKNETTRQCFRKSISALDATSISQFLGRSNSYSTCKDDHFLHFFIFLSRLDGNGCHNRETSPMAILERASKALPAIMNTHSLRAFPCWARFSNVFNDSANAIFKVSIWSSRFFFTFQKVSSWPIEITRD